MIFQISSEDTHDIMFVGQRVGWMEDNCDSFIWVAHERGVEALGENEFDKQLKDADFSDAAMHTQYRRVLGHINWLQLRTP